MLLGWFTSSSNSLLKRAVISRQLESFQSRMLEVQAEIDRIAPLREAEG